MKNAAGDKNCDEYIRQELEEAGITACEFWVSDGEVPSKIVGFLDGWTFHRARYYWVAESDRTVLLFDYADDLHKEFGREVRVDGHCGCPSPREWLSLPWHIGVNRYHVDTQAGLNALADAIREQGERNV